MDLHRCAAQRGLAVPEITLALRSVASAIEAGLSVSEKRWLVPADPAAARWTDLPVGTTAAANRQCD
ncbi:MULTISPECIES: hypothetical protein [Burkholderia cepacia complex]|uniref:hypothetical protein n=1 Tax=Burkholderia cepacia complex TaxID=87882 RepID=UPI000ABEA55A|nr:MULTISPECIES: hypothetical protein [Burkholderia cepacia complex]